MMKSTRARRYSDDMADVTQILHRIEQGDANAAEKL
jgi:hypothetical protein